MTPEEYVKKLIQLSLNKLELLGQVLEETRRQSTVITEDSIEALQKSIDAKQELIDRIDKSDEAFSVYFERLKSIKKVNSLDQLNVHDIDGLSELRQIIEKIVNTLREIENVEQYNNKQAHNVLDKLATEIKKINNGKVATSAYRASKYNAVAATTTYFDTKK